MTTTPGPDDSAALYVRRSHRDAEGSDRAGRSLAEQEADCRELAERHGLTVVGVYAEREGTGASRHSRKARPEWERALADLSEGDRFRTVIVWALDRADRRGAAVIGELLDNHAETGRRILGVDGTDTSDPRQRMMTIIRGEMAREEADLISARVGRTKRRTRDAGVWLGGRAPFGLRVEDGKLRRDPATFPTARRIADMALSGVTLWEISRALNREGVLSPTGREWTRQAVAQILHTPSIAGLQSYRRRDPATGRYAYLPEIYHTPNGEPVSVGEGVVSPDEFSRLRRLVGPSGTQEGARTAAGTPARTPRRAPTTLLAGGLLVCPACGLPASTQGRRDGRRSYRCPAIQRGMGCGGFTAPVEGVDDHVVRAFLGRLAKLRPGAPLLDVVAERWRLFHAPEAADARDAARESLDDARAAVSRVVSLAASGVLTDSETSSVLPGLRAAVSRAEDRLRAIVLPASDLTPLLDEESSWLYWSASPLAEQRALLGMTISRVVVSRADRRGQRFDAESRVTITWADEAEGDA